MSYDPACYNLAVIFLSDSPEKDTEANRDELAQHIQTEIEDWIEYILKPKDSSITGDGTVKGRTTKPELTGSPCGTPQRAGDFSTPESGIIKNRRYFNTGKTYWPDGTLKFDFDASNALDPWFNGTIGKDGFINDYD